ncbi:MAG: cob(I)yrinic acid a,c-diamide adenosyltransferase [Candidatus Woesearchaeota archaeon]
MRTKKPLVYVWTGNGAGKTTSALGTALRMLGHNKKVIIVQFMKGWKNIGEYKIKKKLGKNYEIVQFGRKGWVNLENPSLKDKKLAAKAVDYLEKALRKKPDLLILDEVNIAAAIGLIDTKRIVSLIDKADPKTTIYMTGRYAPKEFIDKADFVNEISIIKMKKGIKARKGIEY